MIYGTSWERPDVYFVLADFESYCETQQKVDIAYKDRMGFAKKAWLNIANSGKFSSDRTITEYAEEIWQIERI